MLIHRGNVRIFEILAKIEGKEAKFFLKTSVAKADEEKYEYGYLLPNSPFYKFIFLCRYLGTLPDHLKQDILARLFNGKWLTYRQAHR